MSAKWLVVLAVVAGCGDNDLETTQHGGSRLTLGWYVADDGTRMATGAIHDLQSGMDCYIQPWSDGVSRCAHADGFVAYGDAQCTQRIVLGSAGSQATDYDRATCAVGALYQTGAATSSMQWYYPNANGCGGPYASSAPVYALGAEIDRSTIPALAVTVPDGGRLRQAYYTSADGLRSPKEVRDTELGVACYPGDTACVPNNSGAAVFSDAKCSQTIVAAYASTCGSETPLVAVPDRLCSDVTHYYRLGAKTATPDMIYMFDAATNACVAGMPDATAEYHQLGEPVTQQLLAPMRALPQGRRLQPIYDVGGGLAAPSGRFFDPDVGTTCVFQQATDGMQRCLPSAVSVSSYFSDAACQHAVTVAAVAHPSIECGVTPPPPVFATRYVTVGTEIDQVKAPYTGELYMTTVLGCTRTSLPLLALYEVGDAIAPASFVAATLQYE